ncbi:hypothetical protein BDA96_02G006100 [Sorghum bicolor]|uniref:Uncharacterized protein n=1 Tax=Sorghum bicolor TaxID=4558 RepID=A0A921RLM1_SORBI|nr:hypothetical protein BDA96_02G006100 [Sorghum bicolor]
MESQSRPRRGQSSALQLYFCHHLVLFFFCIKLYIFRTNNILSHDLLAKRTRSV